MNLSTMMAHLLRGTLSEDPEHIFTYQMGIDTVNTVGDTAVFEMVGKIGDGTKRVRIAVEAIDDWV